MKREIGISYEIAKRMMMKKARIYPPLYCICGRNRAHPDCRCLTRGYDYVGADHYKQVTEGTLS